MRYKSARSKACDISQEVRQAVYDRDEGGCVVCNRLGIPNAHYISRSLGGLGIEQNIVTLCEKCHHEYDNGSKHKEYGDIIREYLDNHYPGFPDEKRFYNRWVKS